VDECKPLQCGAADGSQPDAAAAGVAPAKFCGGAPGPHVMTGPVAVVGAEPGDILQAGAYSRPLFSSTSAVLVSEPFGVHCTVCDEL